MQKLFKVIETGANVTEVTKSNPQSSLEVFFSESYPSGVIGDGMSPVALVACVCGTSGSVTPIMNSTSEAKSKSPNQPPLSANDQVFFEPSKVTCALTENAVISEASPPNNSKKLQIESLLSDSSPCETVSPQNATEVGVENNNTSPTCSLLSIETKQETAENCNESLCVTTHDGGKNIL